VSRVSYPSARRADVMDNDFGTEVADPYRWMEDLASPELRRWIFYSFTSPLYPDTVFRVDPATGNSSPFEAPALTFDPTRDRTERVFVASRDGTRVPVFITHHKGLRKDGLHPTMLYGFGGFGLSETPRFHPEVSAFLERGGVYATASIRGGREYGQAWHEAGSFERKQNVFDDSVAAAWRFWAPRCWTC
jgi:prolyl oligopeptidase